MPGYIKPPSNQYIYSSSTVDGARIMTAASDYGFRNKLINGDLSIWQRAFSANVPSNSNTFCADRWQIQSQGGTAVVSRQDLTPGLIPGLETSYFMRVVQSVGSANTLFIQKIEDVRTLAGQSVTISFWAKASASTTLTSRADQDFGSGGSSRAGNGGTSSTITTSWQRYVHTFSIPSVSGKTIGTSSYLDFFLYFPNTSTITVDIAGIQLESGNFVTPFEFIPQQTELALCQRYYQKIDSTLAGFRYYGSGTVVSTTQGKVYVPFITTTRVNPSITVNGVANTALMHGSNFPTPSSVSADSATINGTGLFVNGTGFVVGQGCIFLSNNSTATSIEINAEF
jgi:hypothetical protein